MVVEVVLVALAVGAAGSAAVVWRRRRVAAAATAALAAGRDARTIGAGELLPGDVVTYMDADWLVEGVATLAEGGRAVLVVASLAGDDGARYLVVDLVEAPRCILAEARDASAFGAAVPSTVDDGPRELRATRRAAVRVTVAGSRAGLPAPGPCEYGVFHGPGDHAALVVVDAAREVSSLAGRALTEAGLVLLPGGGLSSNSDDL
jgi:hypothetical protein